MKRKTRHDHVHMVKPGFSFFTDFTEGDVHIGKIDAASMRASSALPPVAVQTVQAIAGIGLLGDAHASPLSPRQLLLASSAAYEDFALPVHALRENLLVDFDTAQLTSGTVLQVGGEVLLRLMFQCEACGQLDMHRPGLAQKIGQRRGMLARVIAGGVIRQGAPVRDLGRLLPAWPDDWRDRLVQILDAVPANAVIEYKHLARLAGVQSSYCRALPRVIAALGARYAGKAIPSKSATTRRRWEGEGLFDHAPGAATIFI